MILFRVDGNKQIGSGHIMRCLSIADCAAAYYGEQCVFLIASKHLKEAIIKHGHEVVILDTFYDNMGTDLILTQAWIKQNRPTTIIVDSYYVSKQYLLSLQQFCIESAALLVYIDDLLAFPYPCDILINYNLYALDKENEYKHMYQTASTPKFLLGPSYMPLRAEFQNIGRRNVNIIAKNILISTGGADSCHIALSLAKQIILYAEFLQNFHFHFIIGTMNEDAKEIQQMIHNSTLITLHFNLHKIAKLMQHCDLAISAAGSTLYELCATQTPTITYILADNQILGANAFEQRSIMKCAGDLRSLGNYKLVNTLLKECIQLANDYTKRKNIAEQQRKIVDGMGAKRICFSLNG